MADILQQAATWHLRRREGLGPADEVGFERWMADPANAAAFAQVDAVWSGFDSADDLEDAKIAALRARTRQRVRRRRGAGGLMKIAATVAVCAGVSGVYVSQSGQAHENSGRTPLPLELSDGSRVVLDAHTRVRVRFSRGARRVELERGQASFDVARDAQRPFSVTAGSATATVIGTRFNIDRWKDHATVTLFEGRLNVAASSSWLGGHGEPTPLAPGQQVTVRSASISPVAAAEPAAVSAWQDGKLVFSDVSLDEAVAGVNRYGDPQITLADPALGRLRVSGIFSTGDPRAFSTSVARLHGLKVAATPEGISLKPQT